MSLGQLTPIAAPNAPSASTEAPGLEQAVRAWHNAGHSQRAIARELNIDRRKVKRIIDVAA
jgi:DNA-binding transcriptional regulator LsrR (DeoR family)